MSFQESPESPPAPAGPQAAASAAPGVIPGHVALLAVQLCFGLFPYFVKQADAGGFSPRAIAVWRIGVGAAVLSLLALAVHGRRCWPTTKGDMSRLFLCAVLGVVMNQFLALEGMVRSSSIEAGLIMTLIPVFTFAIAAGVGQERFAASRALGIPVACAGALVLLTQSGAAFETSHTFGNLLMASNCLCYASYLILSRGLLARIPPLALIAWVYVLSCPALLPLAWGQDLMPASALEQGALGWRGLVQILVFATVLAYLLNTFALSRVPASVTAVYIYLQPLIAGAAGVLLLDEPLTGSMLLAASLLFLGIFMVTRPRRRVALTAGAAASG